MSRKANDVFRAPAPLTAMDRTTSEAKLIINEQTERRQELTATLRAARMAKEAKQPEPAAKPKKRKS